MTDFNEAISLDPNYAQAYANRAMVSRQTNKLELALPDYNHALTIDPNYAVGYVGRGMVYRQQAQPTQALRDFNKAISIRPDAAPAYLNRGLLYQLQNQHQLAIDDFTTAIGLTQNQAEPFVGRGYLAVGGQPPATSMTRLRSSRRTSRPGPAAVLPMSASATTSAQTAPTRAQHNQSSGFTRVGGRYGQTYQTFD